MKKLIALMLTLAMVLSLAACGVSKDKNPDANNQSNDADQEVVADTVGTKLYADFKTKASGTAQEIADGLLQNEAIQFMGTSMPVEPGLLTGFDNAEITGFKEGVMFGPAIGTIPFIGYIFVLEDGADVEVFKTTLKYNANLRWNICTAADEVVVENEGNTVFFVMCPTFFEEEAGDAAPDVMTPDMNMELAL